MPKIFISYRRNDSAAHAGRLYDHLITRFGQGQVFMDVDAIQPGLDFVDVVREAVGSCDALIAIIGREWLGASDGSGRKRLENPEDLVRLEIATAIERDIRVIPVLVQGAQMPVAPDLPEGLEALARRNSIEVSDNRFRTNVEQLIKALEAPAERLADTVFAEPGELLGGGFVGREREWEILRSKLDDVMQGHGGLVLITGEAGIGKTRLAAELRTYSGAQGCQWLEGRYEKEGSVPLQPYVEAVRTYLRTTPPGSLTGLVEPYSAELGRAFPEIADILGTAPSAGNPGQEDPEAARQRHLEAISHLFIGMTREAPLVLFLDDLQWAPSVDVVRTLAQRASGEPLMLVGAYRDVELDEKLPLSRSVLAMNRDRLFQSLPLHRLGRDEVGQMVSQALGQEPSQHVVDLVFERTEGNPFFVEELVRYMVESRFLSLEEQGWDFREPPSFQMPRSVKVVVEERLERLEEETRRMLAMASVIGQQFALALLQEVTGVEEETLVDAVDLAVEARVLVARSGVGQEVYAFADNQVREVLYEGIGTARRRRYHLRVGEAMEKVHSRRLEGHCDALAHHFLEGNDLERAADYSIKAGDLAYGQSSFPRAYHHYEVAEEVLEELEEESERAAHVQAQLGTHLITGVMLGESGSESTRQDIDHTKRAIEMFGKLGNPGRAAVLHRSLGAAYISGNGVGLDRGEGMHHYQSAVDLMASQEDSLEKVVAYDGLAVGYLHGLELERAEKMAREALRIAQDIGDPDAMTQACTEMGLVLTYQGHLSDGLSYLESAWASAQQARMPWFRERAAAFAANNIGWLGELGYYHKWFARWEEQLGTKRYEAGMLGTMSVVSVRGGQPEDGRVFLARLREIGTNPPLRMHTVAQAILGEWEVAFKDLAALDWKGTGMQRRVAVYLAPYYGRLLLDMGQLEGAEELLRTHWEHCRESGAVTPELNLLPPLIESDVALRDGNWRCRTRREFS